jgi:hypothetical protein
VQAWTAPHKRNAPCPNQNRRGYIVACAATKRKAVSTMKATFKNFTISATFTGEKESAWDSTNYNHSRVTVRNTENGKKTAFDFWGSHKNPELEREYDVLNAFYCFVSDAISGDYDFPDFCAELGYEMEQVKKAWTAWKSCKRAKEKLERIYSGDLCDLANELSEIAG